ncbi:MAG: ABC transporter ATP-binding protein [bacterium]|nr:ABC transporter ATP-binding protein [bacterium]
MAATKNGKDRKKFEKPKDRRGTILRLGRYMLRDKWLLLLALLLNVLSNLLALVGPMLSGYAVDAIEPGEGKVLFGQVFYYARWMLLFYAISALLSYALRVLMLLISRKVVYRMRKDVFDKLLRLPVGYFDTNQTGDILSRISYDIDTVNVSLSNDLIQMLTTVVTVFGAFGMMVVVSSRLVFVFCITVPLSFAITRFISKKTRLLYRLRSQKLGELNGFAEEMISGQKSLKAYHQEANTVASFDEKNREAVDAYYMAEYWSFAGPMVNFVNNLSLTLISVFGALFYLTGQMSVGSISSFVLYSRKFSGPINEAANIINELQSALAAAERVFRTMDEPAEAADLPQAKALVQAKGEVELSHVSFGYEPEHIILHDFNLRVEPGKTIAIVGPTGAGKTTLINLLMRFYDVNSGEIRVDGESVLALTRDSLRRSYAMVLQDTWLFTGSIYENLAYGREGACREEVEAAAKAAWMHSFISHLPQGYDTILSDEGTNISKGQKQLLTIARAMLLDARMLILDEATSNVDTRTEQQIQKAMLRLMEGKTCFVIAHRLSTIRNADWILVVNHGEVVEQGTHESLMSQEGFYRQLYQAQFE